MQNANTNRSIRQAGCEDNPLFEKQIFMENGDFIYRNWKGVDLDGWKTHILDTGQGEPIVFVPIAHGLEVFDSLLVKHFSRRNRVITFRRREDDSVVLGRESRADDIGRVMDYCSIEKAHLVGHSSGSIAATTFALKHPERVLSYVWMNLSPKPAMDMALWKRILANLLKFIPMPDDVVAGVVASSCSGGRKNSLLYERCLESFMSVKQSGRIKSTKKWFERNVWSCSFYDWSSPQKLEGLTMPVIVMNSDNDLVNSARATIMLEKLLPNSYGHKTVKGGYHLFQYPCADQVISFMESFYGSLRVKTA